MDFLAYKNQRCNLEARALLAALSSASASSASALSASTTENGLLDQQQQSQTSDESSERDHEHHHDNIQIARLRYSACVSRPLVHRALRDRYDRCILNPSSSSSSSSASISPNGTFSSSSVDHNNNNSNGADADADDEPCDDDEAAIVHEMTREFDTTWHSFANHPLDKASTALASKIGRSCHDFARRSMSHHCSVYSESPECLQLRREAFLCYVRNGCAELVDRVQQQQQQCYLSNDPTTGIPPDSDSSAISSVAADLAFEVASGVSLVDSLILHRTRQSCQQLKQDLYLCFDKYFNLLSHTNLSAPSSAVPPPPSSTTSTSTSQ